MAVRSLLSGRGGAPAHPQRGLEPPSPQRRRLLGGLAALLSGIASLPAGATSSASPPARTTPLSVLVVGDSLAHDLGAGLAQLTNDSRVRVTNLGRASSGLVRPDFYDWPAALDQLLDRQSYDAVVVSIGTNDQQAIAGQGVNHQRFGEEWQEIYRQRVERMMDRLVQSEIPSFWLGLPSARNARFSQGLAVITGIFEQAAATRPGITFVPIRQLTTDAQGRYAATGSLTGGRSGPLRADDGIHFTGLGNEIVVRHLIGVMSGTLHVALVD